MPDGQVPTTPTTVQLPSALSIISVWPNWTFPTGHETQEQEVSKQLGRICATPGAARAATARRKRKPVVHGQQLLKGITLGGFLVPDDWPKMLVEEVLWSHKL